MKKIILVLLSLCVANFADAASAPKVNNLQVKALISKMKKSSKARALKIKKLSDPLVRFSMAPGTSPKQGEPITVFIQPDTGFTDSEVMIEAKLDGVAAALEHPAKEMWILNLGAMSEIKSHSIVASMFIQDEAQAVQIRDAIASLESEISALNAAIAAATDPTEIAQLTAQRDEKVVLKNQLISALAGLKSAVGEETLQFSVVEQTTGADFPRISDVTPHLVKVSGGTTLTINGANFGSSPEVKLGGIVTAVTSSNSTSITLNTPVFSSEGSQDVEIRFTSGGAVKNAIRKNAFFATNDTVEVPVPTPYIPPTPPVAIAEAVSSPVTVGNLAHVTAVHSYDLNDQTFTYEWRLISKPTASALPLDSTPSGTAQLHGFTPDAPGFYVMELQLEETTAPFSRSNISLAVVEAVAVATAPVGIAEAITPSVNVGEEAQVSASHSYDVNGQPLAFEWRLVAKPSASTLPINEDPAGTAVTYAFTPDAPGTYKMELRIAETTEPYMIGNTSYVQVEAVGPANHAPSGSAPSITVGLGGSKTSQVAVTDPDFWQSKSFFVTQQGTLGTATVSSTGLISYVAGSTEGSDTIKITIVDNGTPPLSATVTVPVEVVANFAPVLVGPILARQKIQGLPYQVRLSMSTALNGVTDSDGTIQSMTWDFGDGTTERSLDTNSAFVFHNYMATGIYHVIFTAVDNLGGSTVLESDVVVTDTDIPTAKFRASPFVGTFPLTVTFDASEASDADGIVNYRWFWPGTTSEEVTTSPVITHVFNSPGSYNVRLRTLDANGAEGESTVPFTLGTSSGGTQAQAQLLVGPPRMLTVGTTASFNGNRSFISTVGGTIANYNWTLNDFATCPSNGCSVNGQTINWDFPAANFYFVGLQVTTGLGFSSMRTLMETIVVNSGTPPRAIMRAPSFTGVAPFTLNADASESYVYPSGAPIVDYAWFWGDGSPVDSGSAPAVSHTYSTVGSYPMRVVTTDADGNKSVFSEVVKVNAAATSPIKKKDTTPTDPEREYQRQLLSGACGMGDGGACYELGRMYGEDGDDLTKSRLWERACGLGYSQACQN